MACMAFSPVLTAIAVGCIGSRTGIRSVIMGLTAVVATVFVQAGMNVLLTPWGIPTLTAPFCITAWLFYCLLVAGNRVVG